MQGSQREFRAGVRSGSGGKTAGDIVWPSVVKELPRIPVAARRRLRRRRAAGGRNQGKRYGRRRNDPHHSDSLDAPGRLPCRTCRGPGARASRQNAVGPAGRQIGSPGPAPGAGGGTAVSGVDGCSRLCGPGLAGGPRTSIRTGKRTTGRGSRSGFGRCPGLETGTGKGGAGAARGRRSFSARPVPVLGDRHHGDHGRPAAQAALRAPDLRLLGRPPGRGCETQADLQ